MQDNFETKAKTWDENPLQVRITSNFVNQLYNSTFLYKSDKIAEVGCGTGLVGLNLAKYVNKIYMIDNSPSMLNVLREKIDNYSINNALVYEGEFEKSSIEDLSGVITFMSLHHIENTEEFVERAYNKLCDNGFLAIGDILSEDGSFHTNITVPHNGFDIDKLSKTIEENGFLILRKHIYDYIEKNEKKYPIFIIIAQK